MNLSREKCELREWFVYVLFDPQTQTAFYIGLTSTLGSVSRLIEMIQVRLAICVIIAFWQLGMKWNFVLWHRQ